MAKPDRTPVTIDLKDPESPPPAPPLDVLEAIVRRHEPTLVLATEGKGSDVVEVYNRHVSAIGGVGALSKGRVKRSTLARYPWALRAVF